MNKKMSDFELITSLGDDDFVIVVGEGENRRISKADLLASIAGGAWIDGGSVTRATFQAGNEVGGDPMIKEFEFLTLEVGQKISEIVIVNEQALAGPSLSAANIQLLNDADDFIAGELLADWPGSDENDLKNTPIGYQDKSGKLFTTGIVLKLRLTTDIEVDDLTEGSIRVLYKLDTLPTDYSS